MAKINGGATIWARKTIDSEIFRDKPDKWFKIWFYIINKVKFMKQGKFDRGKNFIKYEWISESTGATKAQIDHFIRWAKEAQMLATQKATRGMVVNVLTYAFYQDLENYTSDEISDLKATQERHKSDTILKNDKNIKNGKNNTGDLSVAGVKQLMDIFYKINPSLNWGNKTTRSACEWLINKYTLEGALSMAETVIAVQGKPYAPRATTPYAMKEKLADFKIYFDSQKNNKHNFIQL